MAANQVTVVRTINASARALFDVLADPHNHPRLNGDGSVRATVDAPRRLHAGAEFRMRMRHVIPYTITLRVIEFTEGRTIAWQHYAGLIWRWHLTELGTGNRTIVRETFDYSRTRLPSVLWHLSPAPRHNRGNMERSLERLERLVLG
jgi:uncharacterized protein YndB with AHSA1/START domain